MGRSNNRNITSKIKDTNGETSYDSPSNQKNISLKENITDVTVTVKMEQGKKKNT